MRKIFLVAGELSGDKLGAWYINQLRQQDVEFHGVGGSFMKTAGVKIYERMEKLNIVGVVEIIKHLRRILSFLNNLVKHIVNEKFDEVVVIDFPGFNLRLIKKIKKANPNIKITYLSPPQLWIWGAWRIRKLKKFCDDIIVLYPFEVEWYKERGVTAQWRGYPFYDRLKPYFDGASTDRKNIAVIPGSRLIEIKRLLPLFMKIIYRFKLVHPGIKVILPLAESIDEDIVKKMLRETGKMRWGDDIIIVKKEKEKLKALSTCCLALTKPGTVTLELGLLSIPSVVAYKASWLTYFLARAVVKIDYMSLTNLLLREPVFPECIQSDCTEKKIGKELHELYQATLTKNNLYQKNKEKLNTLKKMLS